MAKNRFETMKCGQKSTSYPRFGHSLELSRQRLVREHSFHSQYEPFDIMLEMGQDAAWE